MNPKQTADLQRRLSMGPVPTPPKGLVDKIKQDIPTSSALQAAAETGRRRTMPFSLRVAASIVFLATSTWVCIELLTRSGTEHLATPAVVQRAREVSAESLPVAPQYADRSNANSAAVPPPPAAAYEKSIVSPESAPARRQAATGFAGSITGAPAPTEAALQDGRELAAAAEPPPAAEHRSLADGTRTEAISVTASAPALEKREQARDAAAQVDFEGVQETLIAAAAPAAPTATLPRAAAAQSSAAAESKVEAVQASLFGVPQSDVAFRKVKTAIEGGVQPRDIDVAGLVNYFAGAPQRSRRPVSLEAEGSRAPDGSERMFLRISVDTERSAREAIVARDVRLDVRFNDDIVASHTRVDREETALREKSLLSNASVTMLHEVALRPGANARSVVATVRLTWVDAKGATQVVESEVRASEIARPWSRASRRQRLASLGAIWAESLVRRIDLDVKRRAEELAHQEPADERARELARLAGAPLSY